MNKVVLTGRVTRDIVLKYTTTQKAVAQFTRIRADSYEDKDGKRQYVTKVVVEELEFLERKEKQDDFQPVDQTTLPF